MKTILFFLTAIYLLAANHSFGETNDTTTIINSGPGVLETTINGDVTNKVRNNPNRVYVLQKNQIYVQNAPIAIINPTGTLTIVGESGGRKPIIVMNPINGKKIGQNTVQGSIKLVNIHYQGMQLDKTQNNENWFMTTGPAAPGGSILPQALTIDNCLFEFTNIDFFECNGWTNGAKFFITNSYFRNLFHPSQWWGSRVFMCKNPIDTLWVENVTTTSGGLIFLNQNALTKFAYFNHNTIVNNKKYWLKAPYFVELYVCNNIFINQNWSGEDWENTIKHGEDPDTLITSTIDIDSVNSPGSTATVKVQQEYYTPDSSSYTAALNPGKMKVFISNNIHYSDTLLNKYYTTDAYNALSRNYPLSYLKWFAYNPPYQVVNIPCAWMNARTKAMLALYPRNMIEEDTYTDDPQTPTRGIKDAAVADQMAKWNAYQWSVPGYTSSTNDILHSAYIFGDYDPTTIPGIINGVKTEDAGANAGITKFTDLIENFSQSAYTSVIDNLPIGSLIWNDSLFAQYNSADDYQKVIARYVTLGGSLTGVKESPGVAHDFNLSQNYPNPFNPSTIIAFALPSRSFVTLKIFDILGREVAILTSEELPAGSYTRQWNAANLSSGIYFYRLQARSYIETKKLILLR